jgi:histidinol dehydrogenase
MIKAKRIEELDPLELERILKRSRLAVDSVKPQVQKIIEDVRNRGDAALIDYTTRFDGVVLKPEQLAITKEEVVTAYASTRREIVFALERAAKNIMKFHKRQLPAESWSTEIEKGITIGRIRRPIDSVGIYIPGGRATYPSTVLMTAIPAQIAGVSRVVACTPPMRDGRINPLTLVAANIAGVETMYRIGGAQAIAAMAYGTETIPKVNKIVGPGNIYVTAAKMLVYGQVDIDFPAGPSEILILADETADAKTVAIDLISQAEHDPDAAAVLVTANKLLANEVETKLRQLTRQCHSEVVEASLNKNGALLVANSIEDALSFVNNYAPEHLEVMVANPRSILSRIKHAGSIFLGPYSAVSAGDYATGANHVLPTGGDAKIYAGLSIDDFVKRPTFQMVSRAGLIRLRKTITTLAKAEGLPSHARAVEERLRKGEV